jgi:hypothetical protein
MTHPFNPPLFHDYYEAPYGAVFSSLGPNIFLNTPFSSALNAIDSSLALS